MSTEGSFAYSMPEAMTYTAELGCGCLGTTQGGAAGNVVFDGNLDA